MPNKEIVSQFEQNRISTAHYQATSNYTLRIISCVLFIFLTEICLSHYVYRLIIIEIRENYVSKNDFPGHFIEFIRSDVGRLEIASVMKEISKLEKRVRISFRKKRKTLTFDEELLDGVRNNEEKGNFNYNLLNNLNEHDASDEKMDSPYTINNENWIRAGINDSNLVSL